VFALWCRPFYITFFMSNSLDRPDLRLVNPDNNPDKSIHTPENLETAQEKILSIIERVEEEAREALEAELQLLMIEFFELNDALRDADERIAKMPRSLRDRVLNEVRPYRQQIMARREELINHPGVKTAFADNLLEKLKFAENFGDLSRVAETGIYLELITAGRNQKGNVSFLSVRYIEDKRPSVHNKLKELKIEIHNVCMRLSNEADGKLVNDQKK
jgi:hypothetical protein